MYILILILAGFGVVVVYISGLVMVFESWKFYSHTPVFYNKKTLQYEN